MHILLCGAFPKRHRANCGVIAVIRKVPILGHHNNLVVGSILLVVPLPTNWDIDGILCPE
jgi:hypothetical protein